jgi:hypothetical protein
MGRSLARFPFIVSNQDRLAAVGVLRMVSQGLVRLWIEACELKLLKGFTPASLAGK